MKKFANISVTTGYTTMTIFQKTTQQNITRTVRRLICSLAAVLLLMGCVASVFAQSPDWFDGVSTFHVDDEDELAEAIKHSIQGQTRTIIFTRSIGVETSVNYVLKDGETVILKLSGYNFVGNDRAIFDGPSTPGSRAELVVEGSTMAFGDGITLRDNLKLTYKGIYTSAGTDLLRIAGDGIEVDLTSPGSGWDAFNHDVVIGHHQVSKYTISNGNWAKSKNVFIGNDGDGTLNISGAGTNWKNSLDFIVGKDSVGVLNLSDGAFLTTGNFGVGTDPAGPGTSEGIGIANIWGAGTVLDIYGSNQTSVLKNEGYGNMFVKDRAQVFLRYNDILDNSLGTSPSGTLALGTGTSLFDNAYFKVDRGTIDGENNEMTFQNFAMFEGGNYGFVRDLATQKFVFDNSHFGPQGNGIKLQSLTVQDGAFFSPGYGSSELWEKMVSPNFNSQNDLVYLYNLGRAAEPFYANGNPIVDDRGNPLPVGRYGGIDFTGDFNLAQGGIAVFDFDPEGANHPNTGAEVKQHKDFMDVDGAATLDGTVHFRPMPGYYQNDITVDFMTATGGAVTGTPELSLWPRRWFVKDSWDINDGTLTMQREEKPFHTSAESFNERSVGVALDWIYNREQERYNENLMLDQQNDSEWFPVLDWVWGMSDKDFRTAMRQLSGETRAASFYMPLRSPWRYAFERVNWRKRDNHVYFGQQNILAPYIAKQDIWVTPYYDYMHTSDDGNTSSASTSRTSFMAGYDRALSNSTAVGFLFGYSQPKLNQVYSRVIADDYLFGLHYNTRIANDFELKLWGSYGVQHYRLSRNIPIGNGETIDARYGGNSITASVQVAKPYSFYKGVIRPLAALDYSFVKQAEADEIGYTPIALRYASSDWSQLFGRVGVRGDFGWKRISLTGSVAYSYQIAGDVAPTCTNQFVYGGPASPEFDVKGPNLSRTFVNIGLGSQIYLNKLKSRMFFVQYNGNYGKRTNAQNASLGYQMTF